MTLINEAAKKGALEELPTLLAAGSDVNAQDANGDAPLHVAADAGRPRVVELLLDHGADASAANGAGVRPLEAAVYEGHTDCVQLLLARGAAFDPNIILHLAAAYAGERDKADIVQVLLDRGGEDNARDPRPNFAGATPLHDAVASKYRESTSLLLQRGADVNAVDDLHRRTPLHQAALGGDLQIVALLLERGATSTRSIARVRRRSSSRWTGSARRLGSGTTNPCPRTSGPRPPSKRLRSNA